MRRVILLLHRWVGLALAAFLVIEGLTGALLAFRAELSELFDPRMIAVRPPTGAGPLGLGALAEHAEALAPRGQVAYFAGLSDHEATLRMLPRKDPATGDDYPIDSEIIRLNPWTGDELGRSSFSRYSEGFLPNVMPFVYDLHTTLANTMFGFGDAGLWVLSSVALLWTIDNFAGFYLTFPPTRKAFWLRWKRAWQIKRRGGLFQFNFDLHRAGGLWLWPMLLVFAWSSVNLIDKFGAYDFVTAHVLDYPAPEFYETLFPSRSTPPRPPILGWRAAQNVGERLMTEHAAREGFRVEKPLGLNHLIDAGLYNYTVRTNRSFPSDKLATVFFDADTGVFRSALGTSTGHSGITLTNWLRALHLVQDPVDYPAYRIFVVFVGLTVAMLSITGAYIWLKKRRARLTAAQKARAWARQVSSANV